MSSTYFKNLKTQTDTRFWINNPTLEDLTLAREQGAGNCTTNPAYCSKLIQTDKAYLHTVIDEVLAEEPDIEAAASEVYRRTSKRVMDGLIDIYQSGKGVEGFVTIQDDPRKDTDAKHTMQAVEINRKLGENYMAKIPVIPGGIEAIEKCIEVNIPVCATEVFSISQADHICEVYKKASERSGNSPPMYVTHISGIFDEYLGKVAEREKIDIAPEILRLAGISVARKQYLRMHDRKDKVTLLGGGARENYHFTGIAGGDAHITINWSTAVDIMNSDATVENTINQEIPRKVIDELRDKFPDYRKAYDDDGLTVEGFTHFGPVQLFRNAFLKGWYLLLAEVVSRKHARAL